VLCHHGAGSGDPRTTSQDPRTTGIVEDWIPAFAGMTINGKIRLLKNQAFESV
jgi:hypothetical protein